ncbi:MAG: DUF2384 domain-containing protein [Flavobacteriaceae bacterium]|nr:DUF2384 domain-containing protein [Flavobacteriaceae bacterium]
MITFEGKGINLKTKQHKSNPKLYSQQVESTLKVGEASLVWNSNWERLNLIRNGIPFVAVETISNQLNTLIKDLLNYLGIPQTTYNKKKRDKALFDQRDSETILLLQELIDFGVNVFNGEEEKFQNWLKSPSIALGGVAPESLFDTNTGIEEVRKELTRIEYGIFA